ncbi:hypothetical protein HPB49_004203 [Dermacentor silvarum]|uniref:Uncharacterized protein n=1 Tax=Dermacentor silvarum TaxID=543639 RepID=A0ACB8CV29_DERSI|nr:hypothetical protein HPB49_004203 [Dermacentor silvarum]
MGRITDVMSMCLAMKCAIPAYKSVTEPTYAPHPKPSAAQTVPLRTYHQTTHANTNVSRASIIIPQPTSPALRKPRRYPARHRSGEQLKISSSNKPSRYNKQRGPTSRD